MVLSPVADDVSVLSLPGVMLLEPPPYGGGGVPGGVTLGESKSHPALLFFAFDKSDKDSDTINRFEAVELEKNKASSVKSAKGAFQIQHFKIFRINYPQHWKNYC